MRRTLLIGAALLCILSLPAQLSKYYFSNGHAFQLLRLFALDYEQNGPTCFSSCCLFGAPPSSP